VARISIYLCRSCGYYQTGGKPRLKGGEMSNVKVTERGWVGHFILSHRCSFRRNTLIQGPRDAVIVSTVGDMRGKDGVGVEEIGCNRYYETMAFGVSKNGPYLDADVTEERSFDSPWCINADKPDDLPLEVDNVANDMHEAVVREFVDKMEKEQL